MIVNRFNAYIGLYITPPTHIYTLSILLSNRARRKREDQPWFRFTISQGILLDRKYFKTEQNAEGRRINQCLTSGTYTERFSKLETR